MKPERELKGIHRKKFFFVTSPDKENLAADKGESSSKQLKRAFKNSRDDKNSYPTAMDVEEEGEGGDRMVSSAFRASRMEDENSRLRSKMERQGEEEEEEEAFQTFLCSFCSKADFSEGKLSPKKILMKISHSPIFRQKIFSIHVTISNSQSV